jgi:hypothetical protein
VKPQVFAGLYPVESNQYEALRDALDKLKLNDASLHYEPEVSQALGFGFRCGFLGLLHMDIVQERLEREYDMNLITTAPTVVYQVLERDGTVLEIENPSKLPDPSKVEEIREPIITATILMPQEYVGPVLTLCTEKRGVQKNMLYLGRQVMLTYELPLAEVVMDFFDKLKSVSRGYASLDYEFKEFRPADVVRLDILINGERVDALSVMVHRSVAPVPRPRSGDQDAVADPAADVRRGRAGVDRRADHRARIDQGDAQERARQVLRRRHHAQEEAAGEAEGRQETDEGRRQRRDPAGGVPRDSAGRREMTVGPSGAVPAVRPVRRIAAAAARTAAAAGHRPCDNPRRRIRGFRSTTLTPPMNFALILFLLTAGTGLVALFDRLVLLPRRRQAAARVCATSTPVRATRRPPRRAADRAAAEERALRPPSWVEYSASFFPGAADRVPAALVPGRTVQDSVVVDAAHARGRRLHPGEQVQLRDPAADLEQKVVPLAEPAARRRRGVPLPGQSVAGFHQARDRCRRRLP